MGASVNRNRLKRAYYEGRRQSSQNIPCPYTNEDLAKRWNKGREDQLSGRLPEPPGRPVGQNPAFNSRPDAKEPVRAAEAPPVEKRTPYRMPDSYVVRDRRSDSPHQAGFGKYRKPDRGRGRRY